jgi:hypothetical protein
MLSLAVFGKNVEDAFGHLGYLFFYFAGGFAAMMTQTPMTLAFGTAAEGHIPALGASGAIAAVLGACFVLYPDSTVTGLFVIFPMRLSAWFYLGVWFLFQLAEGNFGIFSASARGGVAFFAHVGGFIFGVVVAAVLLRAGRIARYAGSPAVAALLGLAELAGARGGRLGRRPARPRRRPRRARARPAPWPRGSATWRRRGSDRGSSEGLRAAWLSPARTLDGPQSHWHALPGAEALAALGATPSGLAAEVAADRLRRTGPKRLTPEVRAQAVAGIAPRVAVAWQPLPAGLVSGPAPRDGAPVTTTTTEGRLAEIGRRIDEVHARAQTRAATKAGRARTEAEDAIRELRTRGTGSPAGSTRSVRPPGRRRGTS